MAPPENVKYAVVHLICGLPACRNEQTVYLRVDVPVPEPLRPKEKLGHGGGRGGGLACDRCNFRFPDIAELRRIVEAEIRGRSLPEHLRNEFVTIRC